MPKQNKRKDASSKGSSAAAQKKIKLAVTTKRWREALAQMDTNTEGVGGGTGRVRTFQENSLILLAVKSVLGIWLDSCEAGSMNIEDITWTKLEKRVAKDFKVGAQFVAELRKGLSEDGHIIYRDGEKRGRGSKNHTPKLMISGRQLLSIATYVDSQHSVGKSVTNKKLRVWLKKKHGVKVSKRTMGRYIQKLGLSYRPVKPRKRTLQKYRLTVIRDYLLKLDEYMKAIADGEDIILVYTDESYVHTTHSARCSYVPTGDASINKSASKGRRLIILHAISDKGPLCERVDGIPVDDLDWKGDTPHPGIREDGKVTCETLWLANSKAGDYHDNMTSDMFMQWVEKKLLVTFKKLHPTAKMVLVADNAPYHHKRQIGSLASLSKSKLLDMMETHGCDYVDIPVSDRRFDALDLGDVSGVTDMGGYFRVEFQKEDFEQRASKNKPFLPNLDELRLGFAEWLRDNKPEARECLVERLLRESGHDVLWTPPYCPDLQPIELFWAAGKGRVSDQFENGRKMKETVADLRDGWYGNKHKLSAQDAADPDIFVEPSDCGKLAEHAIKMANKRFIAMCPGLSGMIGNLECDYSLVEAVGTREFPIGLVVLDLAREVIVVNDDDDSSDDSDGD
jgi:transposase/ribosomal protein L30E